VAGVEWVLAAGLLLALVGVGYLLRRVAGFERQLRRRSSVAVDAPGAHALQQVGLVRYQAYHDVGGDHSFALALLDSAGSGVVINSLYHRDRCRVYAKPVHGWQSAITLTDEEKEAIERARTGEDGALTS
jgi:Protein of unknown function (DUF4446)